MGANCKIILPANVRMRDVLAVIGIAVGYEAKVSTLSSGGLSIDMPHDGPRFELADSRSNDFGYIKFDGRQGYWSYEPDYDDAIGKRFFGPTSTAFWCLVGKRLVDFFGGSIDYNDCEGDGPDYKVRERTNKQNYPKDNPEWDVFYHRLLAVEPITQEEMAEFTEAGYGDDDNPYSFDANGRMVRGDNLYKAVEQAA